MHTIFIDGQAGTTGLDIHSRLANRQDLTWITLDDSERKQSAKRAEAINSADIAILCLPDAASREAVSLVRSNRVRVIDTSTAHRVAPGWVYGLPEYRPEQADEIRRAQFVANPGCYPTGVILMLNPLVQAGIMASDYPVCVNAISGYSGGGRKMIEQFENEQAADFTDTPFRAYGLQLNHKHLEEMRIRCGLHQQPIFVPSVSRFRQGMMVQVPIYLSHLQKTLTVAELHQLLQERYADHEMIDIAAQDEAQHTVALDANQYAQSDKLRIYVFGDEQKQQALLVAVYDNLGKGAAGAAIQNLNIMLQYD